MVLFLVWIFIAYGITKIITEGDIFHTVRDYFDKDSTRFVHSIITCPLCCSTWVGFLLSTVILLSGSITPAGILGLPDVITIFLDGMLTAGTVWMISRIESQLS